eukprot:TRINITY_DN49609_c0_g1_i1.p1 TRINITY_DN49609_c0_g1~~TRINITY_DN49609_c0_g1_i1.p1  ORF type:complete len:676 (-),score=112.91 TRINITY_DN49609_c0_g1_i1:105-1985(-)
MLETLPPDALLSTLILMGDGRGGKSYLASRILGNPDIFLSSDSSEPVTDGVDIAVAPMSSLLKEVGMEENQELQNEYLLVFDCEGGNNAMAAIRTLVGVFGILLGTEVVFVASGMASEQSLQALGTLLAARCLVRLGDDYGGGALEQRLLFVVNKNTLRYTEDALEQILDAPYQGSRAELRDTIREAFPQRSFKAVPLMGTPGFEEAVTEVRRYTLKHRQPLKFNGVPVRKGQLGALLNVIVTEVKLTSNISFPSVSRCVVFEGFLLPLVKQVFDQATELGHLPHLEDYNPQLSSKDGRQKVLELFDIQAQQVIGHDPLVQEARSSLQEKLDARWEEITALNETLGDAVVESTMESRESTVRVSDYAALGGTSLIKDIPVRTKTVRTEMRSVIRRRRGHTEHSEWGYTGDEFTKYVETSLVGFEKLPQHEEHLRKENPNIAAKVMHMGKWAYHERLCLLRDGHFLWFDVDEAGVGDADADRGCLNMLLHHAEIVAHERSPTTFTIKPASKDGWEEPRDFTGGAKRVFTFECPTKSDEGNEATQVDRDNLVSRIVGQFCGVSAGARRLGEGLEPAAAVKRRDEWVAALRLHAKFGAAVRDELGRERLLEIFGSKRKHSLAEVRSGWN